MVRITTQHLIQLVLLYLRQCSGSDLPVWAYRVNSCPDPGNFSQWIEASKRLSCYHELDSKTPNEQAMVYHCLPSSFLNETVEFCGTSAPITPGYCPVYNYQNSQSRYPSYQNCGDFTSGCPTKMFHSKYVHLYPACLKINSKSNCYEAQPNCLSVIDSSSLNTTSEIKSTEPTTTMSMVIADNSESLDSVHNVKMTNGEDSIKRIIYIAVPLVVMVVASLAIVIFRKRIIGHYKYLISTSSGTISEDEFRYLSTVSETHSVESSGYSETGSMENEHSNGNQTTSSNESDQHCSQEGLNGRLGDVQTTVPKTLSVQSSAMENEHSRRLGNVQTTEPDTHSVQSSGYSETGSMENKHSKQAGYHESSERVSLLDNMYNGATVGQYNLLLRSLAKHITRKELLRIKDFVKDHTKVKYVINCPNISEYKISELEKLRSTVATLIYANFDDILVSGVKNGCVIVTMMIRNCLIPRLKTLSTSEKMSMTCQSLKYKIIKVMIRDEIVYPPDILSNAAGLAAEKKLSRHVLQSSSEAQIEISKTNDLNGTISSALECKQKTENVEDGVLSKAVEITPKNAHVNNDFTRFLESIGGRITDDTWHSMKILLHDFVDHECVGKMNPNEMLNELANMLKLEYNMSFLEWIFDECGENKLVKECQKFSVENQFLLECFNTNSTPCGESQPFEIQLMVFELETYRDELQDLRYWLAKAIHVHPGQILMTALKNGPVVVTFFLREKHGNAILEYLRTDDGQIAASRKRIEKIVQNGNVIEIGKALNGSNFVQIRLLLRENSSGIHAALRNLASIILRRTGITMEGSEIYTRTVPCDKERNEANAGPVKEESFIKENRNLILEEIELREIEKSAIADLFDEEKLASMRKIKGRRDQAKYFLKLCESLPEEEKERACSYLKRTVSLPEEKSNHEELSSIKKCIQQNKENILDEIDSDFIERIIDRMEDVPEEAKTAWSDRNKSRKEKASIFLEFVLRKDEYIKALKDFMDENGIKGLE